MDSAVEAVFAAWKHHSGQRLNLTVKRRRFIECELAVRSMVDLIMAIEANEWSLDFGAQISADDIDDVHEVFDAWRLATNHLSAKFDNKRKRLILAALHEGWSVDDLKDTVRGWRWSKFHVDNGHNGLDLLLRDASKIEKFMGWERGIDRPKDGLGRVAQKLEAIRTRSLGGLSD